MRYEVSTPDGRRFEITAPDGIAPDVLSREVETALGGGGRQPASEGMPPPRRSWSEVPGAAMRNLPASAQQYYGGLIEAITSPIQTAQGLADLAAGGLRAGARRVLPAGVVEAIDRLDNPETTRRISEAASAAGEHYSRYTTLEGLRDAIAKDPVGVVADISMLFGGGAMAAGRVGATRTAGALRTAEAVTNPLTPIIAPIALAGRGAGAAVERGYRALDPEAAAYMDAAGERAPQIIEALRSPQAEIVPGSRPLPSQIVAPTGSAEFTAFARSAENLLPSEAAARAAEQSRARLSAMREVSGAPAQESRARLAAAPDVTPTGVMPARGGALEAAQEARAAQTGPMFTRAESDVLPSDATIQELMSRPSMRQAVQRAAQIAAEENRPFSMRPPEPPTPTAPSGLLDAEGRPVPAPPTPPAPPAAYSVQDLQYVKRAMDQLIARADSGWGKSERNTRKELIRWIDSQSPAYREARGAFQEASGPIDQMRVARVLENRLTQPVTGEATRGGMFASGIQEAPTTIRRATGEARFSQLSEVLTPDQMRIVDNIRRDIAREEQANKLASQARTGVPNIEAVVTEATGAPRLNFLSRVATIANTIMSKLEGKINQELAIKIATDLMDPQATANALERALRREMNKGATIAAVRAPFETTAEALRNPALRAVPQAMNAMAPEEAAYGYNSMAPVDQTALGRMLLQNPNLRAVMEQGASRLPPQNTRAR